MSKHSGKCTPDCNHYHKHRADCAHGMPTALPNGGTCSVCASPLVKPRYCPVHFAWECSVHNIPSHGEGSWVAITRKTLQQAQKAPTVSHGW